MAKGDILQRNVNPTFGAGTVDAIFPSAITSGSKLRLWVSVRSPDGGGTPGQATTPSGWTLRFTAVQDNSHGYIYEKIAGGSEPTTITITLSTTTNADAFATEIEGTFADLSDSTVYPDSDGEVVAGDNVDIPSSPQSAPTDVRAFFAVFMAFPTNPGAVTWTNSVSQLIDSDNTTQPGVNNATWRIGTRTYSASDSMQSQMQLGTSAFGDGLLLTDDISTGGGGGIPPGVLAHSAANPLVSFARSRFAGV